MSDLIWSPRSGLDLADIDTFLSEYDPAAAARMLIAIRSAVDRLSDYPRLGCPLHEPLRVIGVRNTPYLILYRLRDGVVEVVRIRHARGDWLGTIEAEL
jgi:plasmid stabilization system protein ParE